MAAQGGDPLRRRRISDALAETGSSAGGGPGACHPHRRRSQTAMCWRRCCPCRRNTASRSIYFTMRGILLQRQRLFWAGGRARCGPSSPGPEPCCGKNWRWNVYDRTEISAGNGADRAVPGPAGASGSGYAPGTAEEKAEESSGPFAAGGGTGLRRADYIGAGPLSGPAGVSDSGVGKFCSV